MKPLTFAEARRCVLETVAAYPPVDIEEVRLDSVHNRVLAADLCAAHDIPPCPKSIRDGYAVRAADLPGVLDVVAEIRAGTEWKGRVEAGQAVEIMTGAPVPEGADAVVMVERTRREDNRVHIDYRPEAGEFVNPAGAEAKAGSVLLSAGDRIGYPQVAMLASLGRLRVPVYRKPRVAILSTGDEVVPVDQQPLPFQVRNSNAWSLAAQVQRAGGTAVILPVARDDFDETRRLVDRGLQEDLLLLSGGVSAGKYDIVEKVLEDFGASFYFDRVLIQPGQPLVFGRAAGRFFFGLPGNPASTMVTFEIFARAAMEILGGQRQPMLPLLHSRLAAAFRHKPGLTRFLPARLSPDGGQLHPIPWRGSSDIPALAASNCFLVAEAERESWPAGEWMPVLMR